MDMKCKKKEVKTVGKNLTNKKKTVGKTLTNKS